MSNGTPNTCLSAPPALLSPIAGTRDYYFRNNVPAKGLKPGSQRSKNSVRRHVRLLACGDEAHGLVRKRNGYPNPRRRTLADQLCQSSRRSAEREEITLRLARHKLLANSRAFSRSTSAARFMFSS